MAKKTKKATKSKPKAKAASKKATKRKVGRPPGHYKPDNERRSEMLAFKVTPPQLKQIHAKLKKLAKGMPVAEYLRHAALSCNTKVPA